jgi:putative dimethyl sulfoxide reductase chaperone
MSTTSANTVLAPERRAAEGPDGALNEAAREAARADLARFIAACYYEPTQAFAEERLFDSMRQAASWIDGDLAATAGRLGAAFAATPLQDLLVDYTRLFLGPPSALAKPYASVWIKGDDSALMQDSTVALQALYAEGGFDIADDFLELPDHVAAEMEFLYLLIFRENETRAAGDTPSRARFAQLRRRFLQEHLGRWLGPFMLALHAGAQTDFYELLAELTEAFVRIEGQRDA